MGDMGKHAVGGGRTRAVVSNWGVGEIRLVD